MLMSRAEVSVIPPDLRIINKPLIERLSSIYAGFSCDDAMDIQIIRDEWIRRKARSSARKGTRSLSLRIGTFNVNGKMPTQDLSSWVQGVTASTLNAPKDVESSPPPIDSPSPNSYEKDVSRTSEVLYQAFYSELNVSVQATLNLLWTWQRARPRAQRKQV